nr:hypothetical protein [uncultured Celeribacter sp.]
MKSAVLLERVRDPRLAEHMPLLSGDCTEARIAAFVPAKDACWMLGGLRA